MFSEILVQNEKMNMNNDWVKHHFLAGKLSDNQAA